MVGQQITFRDAYNNIKEGIVIKDNLPDSLEVKYFETTLNMGWMNTVIVESQIVKCKNC
tara:strand:+ start:483 stop:659 length:177 start_codon:yes stop_codon:yes gene_type:complete